MQVTTEFKFSVVLTLPAGKGLIVVNNTKTIYNEITSHSSHRRPIGIAALQLGRVRKRP